MTDPRERVLEACLAEELSGRAPPDLSLRILLAARKGRLTALPWTGGRRWPRRAAAAAVLIAAVAGAALLLLPGAPAVTGSARLRVIGTDGAERWDERFRQGEWVVTAAERDAVLTLGSGTDLTLGPRTALLLAGTGRDAAVRLACGTLLARVPDGERLRVATPFRTLAIAPGSRAEVEVAVDPWLAWAAFPDAARRMAAGQGPAPAALSVTVDVGAVTADGPAASSGESLWFMPGRAPAKGGSPPAAARRRMDDLLAAARVGEVDVTETGPDRFRQVKDAEMAGEALVEFLGEDAARWDYAAPRLSLLPDAGTRPEVRMRLLRLLAWEPGRRSDGLLTRALAEEPDFLEPETVMRLAERGLEPAVERLAVSVAGADAPELRILPAAFFAFRGDDRGREALRSAEASEELRRSRPLEWLAAAAGLGALDGPDRWRESMRRLAAGLAPALDAGQTEYVRWLALAARYFAPAARERRPVTLARLGFAVEAFLAPRDAEFRSATEIGELLRSLAE